MAKIFTQSEKRILSLFEVGSHFIFHQQSYTIILSGKPMSNKGEPKTDIYVLAKSDADNLELKISFKKKNADFLENKITDKRAEQILGQNRVKIIQQATTSIKEKFKSHKLIYKNKSGRTNKGAITLGWKFEFLNVKSGELSDKIDLTREQVIEVYAGKNLDKDKRDAKVNGETIENSGVANYILVEDRPINTLQEAIDALNTIEEYVAYNPNVYFACKALNYRSLDQKYDGNRPLSVQVDWFVNDNKLDRKINFSKPLTVGGNEAYMNLISTLNTLNISDTDDLDDSNVKDPDIIHE